MRHKMKKYMIFYEVQYRHFDSLEYMTIKGNHVVSSYALTETFLNEAIEMILNYHKEKEIRLIEIVSCIATGVVKLDG